MVQGAHPNMGRVFKFACHAISVIILQPDSCLTENQQNYLGKFSFLRSNKESLTRSFQKIEVVLTSFEGLTTFRGSLLSGFIRDHSWG